MADILPEFDDDDLFDDIDAAIRVGQKVIEMCGRLKSIATIAPGAQAKWAMEIDDVRFEIVATVAAPA